MADVRSQGTTRTTLNDNFGGIKGPNEFDRNENEAPALAFLFPQNFLNFGLFVNYLILSRIDSEIYLICIHIICPSS